MDEQHLASEQHLDHHLKQQLERRIIDERQRFRASIRFNEVVTPSIDVAKLRKPHFVHVPTYKGS